MNERISSLLRAAVPPVSDIEPPRDLWPRMQRRLESAQAPRIRVGGWEWALAALLAGSLLLLPGPLAGLLCQF